MAKDPQIKLRPWCPFCGQDVHQPEEPVNRKMDEFKVGHCQCGAVYTSDPSGFNVGSAMVECLNYACNDNWDLAWDLTPEDDYLTGRIDNYDEKTHQVHELKNVDGRKVSGVLYFVRLHKDISDLSTKLDKHKQKKVEAGVKSVNFFIPRIEPERDPTRKKKRAKKLEIKKLADEDDIDALVDFAFDDLKTLRFLQRLLYDPNEDKRWQYAHIIGQVCARLSTRKPGAVSDMLHRMYEACSDSASTHWGLIETIGSVIAARPDIYGAFTRHILMYRGVPSSRVHALWALGTIAETSPAVVSSTPVYSVVEYISHPDSFTRGHAIRLFGRLNATEVKSEIEQQADDPAEVTVYEKGLPVHTTVGTLAKEALTAMQKK
jgi:hypothetical protein